MSTDVKYAAGESVSTQRVTKGIVTYDSFHLQHRMAMTQHSQSTTRGRTWARPTLLRPAPTLRRTSWTWGRAESAWPQVFEVLLPFDERLVASVWFKFLCLHVLCGRKSRRISSLQRSMLVGHRGPCVCVCVCSSCVCVWVVNGKLRRHGKYCFLSSHSVTVLFICACARLSIEARLKGTN